jgi:hypothetical protein
MVTSLMLGPTELPSQRPVSSHMTLTRLSALAATSWLIVSSPTIPATVAAIAENDGWGSAIIT